MSPQALLEKVRVIDLSQYIPGPFATRQLADLGADVIKVEPPGGDPMRFFMQRDKAGLSPIYRHLNRGKRICQLNLKQPEDRRKLADLLENADILLESYRPGVLARLGFGRAQLHSLNPGLIHCALSGYGQNGPYAQRAGHDINYCAVSAQSIVSGSAETPGIGYPPIADHAAALQASIAMLAALHAKKSGRGGVYLDISMTESLMAWQYLPLLGKSTERAASILNGGAACYNIYRCADDRFVSLGALEAGFWENFCKLLGKPEWIARQFEKMPQHGLIDAVAAEIAAQPGRHWQQIFDSVDCCFELLFAPDELANHAQFRARHAIDENGPTYPAWIDQRALRPDSSPELVDAVDALCWKSSGAI